MTAKEELAKQRVLAVYPKASMGRWEPISGDRQYTVMEDWDAEFPVRIGFSKESPEAAWQNAAESLPAQPVGELQWNGVGNPNNAENWERPASTNSPAIPAIELGTCMASFVPHTRGTYCLDWVPVAPVEANSPEIPDSSTVEAKEKERYEASDDLSLKCNLLAGHYQEYHSDGHTDWLTSEPKPTLSTPAEHPRADCEGCNKPDCPCNSLEEAMKLHGEDEIVGCYLGELMSHFGDIDDAWDKKDVEFQEDLLRRLFRDAIADSKTQPDSSSIPEQTFARTWNKFVAANDTEEWKASDIAEWFWNAAKGSR